MMTDAYPSPDRAFLSATPVSTARASTAQASATTVSATSLIRWIGAAMAILWLAVALPAHAQDSMEIVPINVNEASIEVLTELPGIGPSKAQTIVANREANGPFSSLEDLTRVSGIGEATVERLEGEISF